MTQLAAIQTESWHGCYDGGWNGLITPESFAHPAKFSYRLVQRIVQFGIQQGFWRKGDRIGDPFGGVGLGGIVAAYEGIGWVGVELEPRFHQLSLANVELHRHKWERLGCPIPVCLQGDSREFARLVGECGGIVTSPPYAGTPLEPDAGSSPEAKMERLLAAGKYKEAELVRQHMSGENSNLRKKDYGTTRGQIGALKEGTLDGCVTSPPYADTTNVGEYRDPEKCKAREERYLAAHPELKGKRPAFLPYGSSDGQIGALKEGTLEGIVTSPPWENQEPSHGQRDCFQPNNDTTRRLIDSEYGTAEGQLGNTSGTTYWEAMALVYQQMHLAMKPDACAAIVVKDYVKNKQIVPLCDRTCELLAHLGFDVFLRVHAMLTKETKENDLFETVTTKKSKRSSFFRRLYESKYPENAIDFEEVLFARKSTALPLDAATSPQ